MSALLSRYLQCDDLRHEAEADGDLAGVATLLMVMDDIWVQLDDADRARLDARVAP